jgi:hypothetical protein
MARMTMIEAIRDAQDVMMTNDRNVVVFGRDETSAPKGPLDCSYGWSAAEPVDRSLPHCGIAPEGRRSFDARHVLSASSPCRHLDEGP